ncbi:NAD-dependent epimerase/dehydratase family protein [Parabacteroides goldsteinii]
MNKIIEEDLKEIVSSSLIDWNRFKSKTVLITGANGMLPSYLVFTLLYLNKCKDLNINIIALVRNKERAYQKFNNINDSHLKLLVQDVSSPIKIKEDVHFIIHAASQASPKYYSIDPVGTINANVLGTINTLQLAKDKKVESYLFFSSGEIYGKVNPELFPFKENDYGYIDLLNVRSCYCESKRMGENLCVSYNYQYDIPTKIIRIFHTFGPGMLLDDKRVFADFCSNIINNEDIILKSDGSAIRLFCYISDAIIAFLKVLLNGNNANAYNVANLDGEISILELANLLVSLYPEKNLHVKTAKEVEETDLKKMRSTLQKAIPDCSKIKKLGWYPTVSLKEGFKRTISSFNVEIMK